MVILDTNIIIDHIRIEGKQRSLLQKFIIESNHENLAISVATIQELYAGQSSKNEDKEEYILSTISPLQILPYTYDIAQLAGEILRDYSNSIGFADAAIAATAIVNGVKLFTKNAKDFQKIKNLELAK